MCLWIRHIARQHTDGSLLSTLSCSRGKEPIQMVGGSDAASIKHVVFHTSHPAGNIGRYRQGTFDSGLSEVVTG